MPSISFDMRIGPAFLGVIVQTIVIVIGATFFYASQVNTANNTKETADVLKAIVEKQDRRQNVMTERLVKVETSLDDVKSGVALIGQRLNQIKVP